MGWCSCAIGGATPVERPPPGKGPDTAVCVQRDLERKDGPGARYGVGVWRAAAGMVALWKDEARALRSGLDAADEVVRPVLDKELAEIERATAKIELKKVQAAAGGSGGVP